MNSQLKRIVKRQHVCDLYLAVHEALGRAPGADAESSATTISVTSSTAREGKTFVALSMAIQAAESNGKRTLLVDTGAPHRRCATRILAKSVPDGTPQQPVGEGESRKTGFPLLDLLTWQHIRGAQPPEEALSGVLERLQSNYDLIIIDAISMSDGPRVYDILRCSDCVLFVVEHKRLSVAQIRSYLTQIKSPEILGAVLNKRRYPIPGFIYNRI